LTAYSSENIALSSLTVEYSDLINNFTTVVTIGFSLWNWRYL